jgi:hypothetical protein
MQNYTFFGNETGALFVNPPPDTGKYYQIKYVICDDGSPYLCTIYTQKVFILPQGYEYLFERLSEKLLNDTIDLIRLEYLRL